MSLIRELTDDGIVEVKNDASLMKAAFLSHGTIECRDLTKSRAFYEEFVGLECVQHAKRSMAVRCGLKFHLICLEVGESVYPMKLHNHWGLDLRTREDVDQAQKIALGAKEKYEIREVTEPMEVHGVYSFYVQDRDSNWWEFQHYEAGFQDEDIFDFGDRFKADGTPV
jgi:catechol 2,3-dioxygenase-like lactoylglutathione lyase family enzyme